MIRSCRFDKLMPEFLFLVFFLLPFIILYLYAAGYALRALVKHEYRRLSQSHTGKLK